MLNVKITMQDLKEANVIGVRVFNILMREGYTTLQQIENFTYEQAYFLKFSTHRTARDIMSLIELSKTAKGIEEIARVYEVKSLKQQLTQLLTINSIKKNRKAQLLLNLASDRACSFGELRNSILICGRILA